MYASTWAPAITRQTLLNMSLIALLMAILGLSAARSAPPGPLAPVQPSTSAKLPALFGDAAPLRFEPNAGQFDARARFVARTAESTLFFTEAAVVLRLPGPPAADAAGGGARTDALLNMEFVGSSAGHAVQGAALLPGKANYLLGTDPAQWRTGLPTYSSIRYSGLYAGIDLEYAGAEGHLKGTYTVAPHADPTQIRWRYTGADRPAVGANGELEIPLPGSMGEAARLIEQAPVAWQEIGGGRVPVNVVYTVASDGTAGFRVASYDPSRPLIIDPTLIYSTYLGGVGFDNGLSIAVDAAGAAYVTGLTDSQNFPLANALYTVYEGNSDVFVSKFAADGRTLVYSTYLGGNDIDYGYDIAVDGSGNAYVTGRTSSPNFPALNGYRGPISGAAPDAFLTKLNATGTAILYSTYFGGTGSDIAWGVAVDGMEKAYIVGETIASDFPALHGYQTTYGGGTDAFLAAFDTRASGPASLLYATYLGGSGQDNAGGRTLAEIGHGVAVDDAGNAYVTGVTSSPNFPTQNAYDATYGGNGNPDGWAARINTSAAGAGSLVYATYLGDTGIDGGHDIALDAQGNAYIAGVSGSVSFPTRNPYATCFGNPGPFVTKLNMAASGDASLVYSTCFGPDGLGSAAAIAVDGQGQAYITGETRSATFPTRFPVQGNLRGFEDAFVLKLSVGGSALVYSTYLGGDGNEAGQGIAVDAQGAAYVTGSTASANFPTQAAYQGASAGGTADAFVTKLADVQASCQIAFSDVPAGSAFYPYVQCLACRDILGGYADGTFRTSANVTRGQLAKILANAAGFSESVSGQTFTDVPPTSPFYLYVERMARRGIIAGYADGTFRPGANATRGQIAKIAANAAGFTEAVSGQTFADVPPTSPFYAFVERMARRGIIGGYGDGTFRPNADATRGQTAKITSNTFFPNCQLGTAAPAQGQPEQPAAPPAPKAKP